MGNVEKYGLLALFVLCALIVGVGVFGDDGKADGFVPGEKPPADLARVEPGVAVQPDSADRLASSGEQLEQVPPRQRRSTFPDELWRAQTPTLLEDDPTVHSKASATSHTPSQPRPKKRAARQIKVRSGDTLLKIAKRELGSSRQWRRIARANPHVNPDRLKIGAFLTIPDAVTAHATTKSKGAAHKGTSPRVYRVRKGDTLEHIAKRFYKARRHAGYLARVNGMRKSQVLAIGRVLRVPALPSK